MGGPTRGGLSSGANIEFPYRKYTGAPMMKKSPVQSEEDAWNLTVPEDITTVGTMPVALEFSRLQYEAGMTVTVQVGSPLTWAGSVCGEERLMVWVIKKPDLVHHVLRVITDFIKKKADYWMDQFGAERLMAFDLCIETNKLYSPSSSKPSGSPTCGDPRSYDQAGHGHIPEPHLRRTEQEPAAVVPAQLRQARHGQRGQGSGALQSRARCSPIASSWGMWTPSRSRRARPTRCGRLQDVASTRARTIRADTPS